MNFEKFIESYKTHIEKIDDFSPLNGYKTSQYTTTQVKNVLQNAYGIGTDPIQLQTDKLTNALLESIFNIDNYLSTDKILISDKEPCDMLIFKILSRMDRYNTCIIPAKLLAHIAYNRNFISNPDVKNCSDYMSYIGDLYKMKIYTVNVEYNAIYFAKDFICSLRSLNFYQIAGMSPTTTTQVSLMFSNNYINCEKIDLEINHTKWSRSQKLSSISQVDNL